MELDRVIKPKELLLVDKVVAEIQDELAKSIPWLDHIFGLCQILSVKKKNRVTKYPAVYIGDNKYQPVLPDESLKNYCFFSLEGAEEISAPENRVTQTIKTRCGVIFWFNLNTIYRGNETRHVQKAKQEVLTSLNQNLLMRHGKFVVDKIYTESSDLFRTHNFDLFQNFDLIETKSQYLMHPYAGLKFEGDLLYIEAV